MGECIEKKFGEVWWLLISMPLLGKLTILKVLKVTGIDISTAYL